MIAQINRFHGRTAIGLVYKKGKAVRSDAVTLRYSPSKKKDYRLAVVVSRKVSKSAVVRNRIRRRIYEAVRDERRRHGAEWPFDLVLSVFDEKVATMPPEALRECIHKILKRADVLSA